MPLIGFSLAGNRAASHGGLECKRVAKRRSCTTFLAALNPSQATSRGGFSFGDLQPRIRRGLTGRDAGYLQLWASPERQKGRRRQHPRTNGYRVCAAPLPMHRRKPSLVVGWLGFTLHPEVLKRSP